MRSGKAISIVAASVACFLSCLTPAEAQLTEYIWDASKTGSQVWQQSGNWAPSGIPNGPLHTANLARPLGASLNVNLGTGVTIAGLELGGTASPVTTEISGAVASLLTFRNGILPPGVTEDADFNGDTYVDGADLLIWQRGLGLGGQTNNHNGDADANTAVNGADLDVWKDQFGFGLETFNEGAAFINSIGVAGSTNLISAPVHLDNEQVEIAGERNLSINGPLTYIGDPADGGRSDAALRVITPGLTVTFNGGITIADVDPVEVPEDTDEVDFRLNDIDRSQGTIIVSSIISGSGDLVIGTGDDTPRLPLGTVVLNGANTFSGSIRAGRGNLVLGHDHALGVDPGEMPGPEDDELATYRTDGAPNQFGFNLVSDNDDRVIPNPMTIAQWQTFKGEHSLEWAGEIEQTNNRGIVNLLPAGKEVELSGRVNIFEEFEPNLERRFEIHGTGKTLMTGSIRDVPDDATGLPQEHELVKHGFGVLVVDVAPGDNNHIGDDVIYMGNWHYANNDSLNVVGLISSFGGAIGVDEGVSTNTTFMSRIRPTSVGGLQLAVSDANATLDFTGTLANAANMTVAAPETGLTFTGSIIPAEGRYQLGGGAGTLTLPNAQLTGSNRLEVRNGGTVQLLGDNTYTGSTAILTKYSTAHDAQAAADSNDPDLSIGSVYYEEVAPTLVVDKLSNGGAASSIGSASSDASNLLIQGSTLKYIGAGDSTNRLFTIGTGGATIDSSGTGAVTFSNTGLLGRADVVDKFGDLDDFTGTNDSNALYNLDDTSDIIVGMTVTDPETGGFGAPGPGGLPVGSNPPIIPGPDSLINPSPDPTTVTGVSDDGRTVGISARYGARQKLSTRLVFGAVGRTLTLTGSNGGANTLAAQITDSAAGSVVGVTKTGTGTWRLSGNNTYTGPTTVEQGTLSAVAMGGDLVLSGGTVAPGVGVGALSVGGDFTQSSGTALAIDLASASSFDVVNVTGEANLAGSVQVSLLGGFNPAVGASFDVLSASALNIAGITVTGPGGWSANAVGNTLRLTRTALGSAIAAAVPEPSAAVLLAIAIGGLIRRRRP